MTYLGSELGRPDLKTVTVYRDESEVFDEESLRSFAYKPVTDDHPPVSVDAKNWRTYSRGQLGGKAMRDGEHIEFPLVVMDAGLIEKINAGKVQLSAGYTAEITFEDNVAPDGTPYQAKMTNIRGNHVACVQNGRALTARLGDAWPVETKDSNRKKDVNVKTVMIDGLPIKTDDADAIEAGVNKLTAARDAATALAAAAEKKLTDAEAKAATDLAAKDAKIATMDAEIASLKKSVEDAKVTPEQMREMAKAHSALTDAATKMGFTVTDAMSDAEIKKGAVLKVLGDSYAEKTEAFFDAAFEIESGKLKVADNGTDPYRVAMGDRKVADFNVNDEVAAARKAREDYIKSLSNPASAEAK